MSEPQPNLFICGAPRAGTTSLYRYLRQHPDVCMSKRKETGVFLENYDKGLDWLASNYLTHYDGEAIVGESTTGHMQHPPSAQRMAEAVPQAHLVFLLRDPVERIYSHYRFYRQNGRLSPEDSFSQLIREADSEWRQVQIDNGLYHKHLTRFTRFFDRSQMAIFLFRDLKKEPQSVAQKLYRFLGVAPNFSPDVSQSYNTGGIPRQETLYRLVQRVWGPVRRQIGIGVLDATQPLRDRIRGWLTKDYHPPMSEADRAYLQELYRELNRRLEEWLGQDLSHWT